MLHGLVKWHFRRNVPLPVTSIQSYFWRLPRPQFLNLGTELRILHRVLLWTAGLSLSKNRLNHMGTECALSSSGCLKTSFRFLVKLQLKKCKMRGIFNVGKRALYLHPLSLHKHVNYQWIEHLLSKAPLWRGPEMINKVLEVFIRTALSHGLKK